jgi:hypothetical protein
LKKSNSPKINQKFDANEIPDLLAKYRGQELSGKYEWIEKLTSIEARDELLFRFHRLIATLVNVCITGRPNTFSSYQVTFLQLFSGKSVPLQSVATMLKKELSFYTKEELFSIGQVAVLMAIEKTETNLASTIVMFFKDLIYSLIKNENSNKHSNIVPEDIKAEEFEEEVLLNVFIASLEPYEQFIVRNVMNGKNNLPISDELKEKLSFFLFNSN